MRNYREATNYVCDLVENKVGKDGQLNEKEGTFAEFVFGFSDICGVEYVQTSIPLDANEKKVFGHYAVHPHVANHLVAFSALDEHFFDYCIGICSHNLQVNFPLVPPLNRFCSNVLIGKVVRPTKKSRPRKKNWSEKFLLWSTALDVLDNYDLTLTRNDEGGEKNSACDAVAEGLSVCGRKTRYAEIKNIMVHPDYARLRMEFEVSRKIFNRSQKILEGGLALDRSQKDVILEATVDDVLDIMGTFPATWEITNAIN